MKKRLAALVLAILMVTSLSPFPVAADSVYFTAGDERILDLYDATMPFWFGGYLYVAATLFRESGVGYSYNTVQQTLVLFDSSRSLVFDLASSSSTDGQGEAYAHTAVVRGGIAFLPVSPVASYFGRIYSNTRVNHGYLIRVRGGSASLSDVLFVDSATSTIESRYQQYLGRQAITTAPTPTAPVVTPAETSAGQTIYLCLLAEDAQLIDQWRETLRGQNAHATFYFTEEALSRSGDQLRKLVTEGQALGLATNADAGAAGDQLSRMNEQLFAATGVKTRLVYAPLGDVAGLQGAGYCPLSPRVDRGAYGLTSGGGASTLLRTIGEYKGAVTVWLGGNVTARGLHTFLSIARTEDNRLVALTEITS